MSTPVLGIVLGICLKKEKNMATTVKEILNMVSSYLACYHFGWPVVPTAEEYLKRFIVIDFEEDEAVPCLRFRRKYLESIGVSSPVTTAVLNSAIERAGEGRNNVLWCYKLEHIAPMVEVANLGLFVEETWKGFFVKW